MKQIRWIGKMPGFGHGGYEAAVSRLKSLGFDLQGAKVKIKKEGEEIVYTTVIEDIALNDSVFRLSCRVTIEDTVTNVVVGLKDPHSRWLLQEIQVIKPQEPEVLDLF